MKEKLTIKSRESKSIKPILTFYTCAKCGKTSYAQIKPLNGETAKCICGSSNTISNIKKAQANCSCCGDQSRFYVDKNSNFKEIKCKTCEAFIDMKYIKKKNMYINL